MHRNMLRFVMYTVIEALIPVTNMVVTSGNAAILSLHQQMLEQLKQGDRAGLKASMDKLLDYLLQKFAQASAGKA